MKTLYSLVLTAIFLTANFSHAGGAAAPTSSPEFEMMKSLVGTWKGTATMEGKPENIQVKYKLTSGGTAIEETLMPGTPKEMVTVYFLDGSKLMMTHYCSLGNQPRMKLTESVKDKKLTFKMVDATGMKTANDPHMGGLTITWKDKDHIQQEWVHFAPDGKTEAHLFTYQREQ